jgi:hypothetical protein
VPQWPISRAQRRLVVALGVSAALHAWLVHSHYGKGMARGNADGVSIAARILPVAAEAGQTGNPSAATREVLAVIEPKIPEARAADARKLPPLSITTTAAAALGAVTIPATALSQPSDPNYYTAGDLDVFPKALVKPDLAAAIGASHQPAAGKVRATVLIDEAGVVNAVRNLEAPAGDIESAARELLLRTRFTPARNKEGRIVKAQVLVALDYDTRAAPAAR